MLMQTRLDAPVRSPGSLPDQCCRRPLTPLPAASAITPADTLFSIFFQRRAGKRRRFSTTAETHLAMKGGIMKTKTRSINQMIEEQVQKWQIMRKTPP